MLAQIHIKDFAIIEEITVDLQPGFSVFTGETGAGKSILIEALGLTLGDRADPVMVRTGSQRAAITAVFDLKPNPTLQEILAGHGLELENDEVILRRQIEADGRSRAYCNGTAVPAQLLREVGSWLVDVHGQHAHHSLLRRDAQRDLLDAAGNYSESLAAVATSFDRWRKLRETQLTLSALQPEARARELELLRYQARELEALNPQAEELAELQREHRRLSNMAKIVSHSTRLQERLSEGEGSAAEALAAAARDLQTLLELDPQLQPLAELVDSAQVAVAEAASEARHYLLGLDGDASNLDTVEARLGALHEVARKHHTGIERLPELLQETRQRLADLEDHEARLAILDSELRQEREHYRDAARQLHQQRQTAATRLSHEITANLRELGMPAGQFQIEVAAQDEAEPTASGSDRIEFLVSANAGQPPRPLAKIASGGELSRISLAIQVATTNDKAIPTMVFDEIDVGIGGGVAEILGKRLRKLSASCQVLCVTHHAQVAAQAQQHFKIKKETVGGSTLPSVEALIGEQRVAELARMLGGVKLSERALDHAREMLQLAAAESPKKGRRRTSA